MPLLFWSPPLRRRGSKPTQPAPRTGLHLSPPPRRRGSKRSRRPARRAQLPVASPAEAWIETTKAMPARPSAGRRLPRGGVDRNKVAGVDGKAWSSRLPRGGVDRNMAKRVGRLRPCRSPPPRRRGSKLTAPESLAGLEASPPPRRRGSKLGGYDTHESGWGRLPRGGVDRNKTDVETIRRRLKSPPPRRRGSKRVITNILANDARSPPPRRRGSKLCAQIRREVAQRRLPRGGVDRNL